MKYYLGIDSGGTKTKFTLADKQGNIVCNVMSQTTNYLQIGYDLVASNLQEGIQDLLETSKIKKEEIAKTFIGLASYGEIKADSDKVEACLKKGLDGLNFIAGNDNLCGWSGSLAGKPGINIVSGTGSIAYGRNAKNQEIRCGGWGHYFGCDEGSAYWIGSRLVKEFTHQSDGRSAKTMLYDYFVSNYMLRDDFDLLDLMVNQWKMDRTKIAQLCRTATELAQMGDKVALDIFDDAGRELANMVNTCIHQIEFGDHVAVSYSGGVFKSGDLILKPMKKYLHPSAVLTPPKFEPAIGGVILAMTYDGRKVTDSIIQHLMKTQ